MGPGTCVDVHCARWPCAEQQQILHARARCISLTRRPHASCPYAPCALDPLPSPPCPARTCRIGKQHPPRGRHKHEVDQVGGQPEAPASGIPKGGRRWGSASACLVSSSVSQTHAALPQPIALLQPRHSRADSHVASKRAGATASRGPKHLEPWLQLTPAQHSRSPPY